MRRVLPAILVLFLPIQALAQPAPRETVASIASEIRDRYFSVARGDAIADALEAEAAAGKYDALTDPRDLASALSNRLRPEDAHFNVVWSSEPMPAPPPGAGPPRLPPGAAGVPPAPPPSAPSPDDDPQRLINYGFTRIENLPGNIGLIEMRGFSNIDWGNDNDRARRAADAALALVSGADAVIFDLRNNGGGSPGMVGYLVSAFTPPDANIYNVFHNRQGTRDEKPGAFYPRPRLDVPVYVLISGRTGSAAEAFPYTLQAAKRATIVGEASGGAANPGGIAPIPGGFRIFISGGSPINPVTGRNWEGTGVVPDIAVAAADALQTAQVDALKAIIAADNERTDAVWSLELLETKAKPPADLSPYAGSFGPMTISATDGALELRNGRRPPLRLTPLGPDLFGHPTDPWVRFAFQRDAGGAVTAVDQLDPYGPARRQRRNSP